MVALDAGDAAGIVTVAAGGISAPHDATTRLATSTWTKRTTKKP
jgi:hypothetical protein